MRANRHIPEAEGQPSLFFTRLAQWSEAPRVVGLFQTVVDTPLSLPLPFLHVRLYQLLIDHLLQQLGLPQSDGAQEWEWKPLYQFGQSVDPHYFTEASIHQLLEQWPAIDAEQRRLMVSVLSGYFHLRRAGFPNCYPAATMPVADLERWVRIFPAEWTWASLRILRRLGFTTMASRQGFRAFVRFTDGEFEPRYDPNSLRRWFSECWRAVPVVPGDVPEEKRAYPANTIAAAFSDRLAAVGVEGPCGYIPDCVHCPLSDQCRWYNAPISERPGPSEILALVRRGHAEHLRTDQLLQGLYKLQDADAERVRTALNDMPLREIASLSFQELEERFGFHWLLPERLGVTIELGRRFNEERMAVGRTFQTPWDVFRHFRIRLRDLKQEQFIVVLLDNKKRFLDDLVITQGTLSSSPVHPREVFNAAIRGSAASVVVVHNHPSGDPQPSREDIHVTQQLMKVGDLVGIPVLDHIIIADDQYVSMLEQGLLKG